VPAPRSRRCAGLAVLAVTAALTMTLTACGSGGDDVRTVPGGAGTDRSTGAGVDGDWTLVAGRGTGGPLRLVDGRPVTLTVRGRDVGGRSACNSYSGTATRDGDGFVPGALAVTEMACVDAGVMALESGYLDALARVTRVSVAGDRLVLHGAGVELTFARRPPVPDLAVEGVRWNLDTLVEGESASTTLGAAFLRLDGTGGLTGNGGCRDLVGRYRLEGGTLTVSGLRLVEPAAADCGADPAAQDDRVTAVLGAPMRVEVAGRRLTLTAGSLGLGFSAATGD